jgi:hypothetical protein
MRHHAKYWTTAQATNDSVKGVLRFACWVTLGYKHTLSVCNTYFFSTTRMVALTRLSVTLYANCLSCQYKTSYPTELLPPTHVR